MNLPFANILGPYTGPDGKEMPQGAVKTPEQLQTLFADRGVDMKKPFTTSCGTGKSSVNSNFIFNALNVRRYKNFFFSFAFGTDFGHFLWSCCRVKFSVY